MARTFRNRSRAYVSKILGMGDRFFWDGQVGGWSPGTKNALKASKGSKRMAQKEATMSLIEENNK